MSHRFKLLVIGFKNTLDEDRTRQNVIVDFTCMMKIIGLLWHFIMSDRKIQANSVAVTPVF